MTVKVKVCGITRKVDLDAAANAGADSVGFVVAVPSSPRNISFSEARRLICQAPSSLDTVAVTVYNGATMLRKMRSQVKPDLIQIHGGVDLAIERERSLAAKIIRAVDMSSSRVREEAVRSAEIYRAILLDTCGERGVGGTGVAHDWRLSRIVRDLIHPKPTILAGGLRADNVAEAIRVVEPYGVDVSSGVEAKPGVKDPEKILQFVMMAKGEMK